MAVHLDMDLLTFYLIVNRIVAASGFTNLFEMCILGDMFGGCIRCILVH